MKNGKNQVQLTWAPADGGNVNVCGTAKSVGTTPDNGKFNDSLGTQSGKFTYQVCETDSGDCSNEVERHISLSAWFASGSRPHRLLE